MRTRVTTTLLWITVLLTACGPASGGDPELWTPIAGDVTDGAGGAAGSSSTSAPSPDGAGEMTLAFTTVSFGGEYAPRNVGAVWVEDDMQGFVKTLEVWGTKRLKYLERWKAASGGNVVDAVTGATRDGHGAHAITWDGQGLDGKPIADGLYHVVIEVTEHNGAGVFTLIDLEKSPDPFEASPPDTPYFVDQQLRWEPAP